MDRDRAEPQVDDLPGERARRVVDAHHAHAAPSTYVYEFVWDHSQPAIGPFCTDVDGNVLMDFTGHVGAMPLGYNNPKILEPLAGFDLVDPLKIAGQDFYAASSGTDVPTATDLMDRLTDACRYYDMDTVFLSNSGAEAVENGLKIAHDHTRGTDAITFEGAFHGRTLGALSLNRSKGIYREAFPEIASVHAAPFCTDRDCDPMSRGDGTCECGLFAGETSWLETMLDEETGYVSPGELAYLILEPVQGEGGYRIPSEAFGEEIARLQTDYDVTVIVDEVQTGLGRSGEFWASDHYAYEPDVIAAGKGLRVGATISRAAVFPDRESRLSSTWGGGDLLACAQGALTIEAVHEYDLLDNATARGRQFCELLADETLPGVVDVRGLGLLLGVEFESRARRDDVMDAAFAEGLLLLGCGDRTLRVLPPLDATEREIQLGADRLAGAVRSVA